MEYVQKRPTFPTGRTASRNMMTNPTAAVDLTDAVGTQATLVRQTAITAFATSHGTAFRLNATGAAANVTIGGDYGALRLGMVAGKTYTIYATFFVDTALTGTTTTPLRQIAIGVQQPSVNSGVAYYLAVSNQALNVANLAQRLKVTFTLPADTTSAIVRLVTGHSGGVSYWADVLMVEGNGLESDGSTMNYFDGDTAATYSYNYAWTGTVGKSPSTRTLNTVPADWAEDVNIVERADATAYVTAANALGNGYEYQLALHCQA